MPTQRNNPKPVTIHVQPDGSDTNNGLSPRHGRGKTGPLATPHGAQRAVRKVLRAAKEPVAINVVFACGRYELKRPLKLTTSDSGWPARYRKWTVARPAHNVIWSASPGHHVVFSGGKTITNFKETALDDGRRVWVASLGQVTKGNWAFEQLFVNGQRAKRPRLPVGGGEFRFAKVIETGDDRVPWCGGNTSIQFAEGDLKADWHNLQDVEVVAMHVWMSSRMKIDSINEKKHLVTFQWPSSGRLNETHYPPIVPAPYYVENVFEAIQPGQWYLDRPAGKLYYMPHADQQIDKTDIVAPRLERLIDIEGDADNDRFVEGIRFENIQFSHAQWQVDRQQAAYGQAAAETGGAVTAHGLRQAAFVGCRFSGVAAYGLELTGACRDVDIRRCTFTDLGAGGVKIWHVDRQGRHIRSATPPCTHGCRRITIADNDMCDGGQIHLQAVGILIGRCMACTVVHNDIHHFLYTGISIGWTWGYGEENHAYGNVVEYNHIHDIGQGKLSDMGGIYMLGLAHGTRVRFNVIHDVHSRGYGGWGLYADEGSTGVLLESNLVYRCSRACFHQHFGRDNILRNNIFAFGGESVLQQTRAEEHMTCRFSRNIFYADGESMLGGTEGDYMFGAYTPQTLHLSNNLYWDASGKELRILGQTMKQWQARGFDEGSMVADPKFTAPQAGDFSLAADSPAWSIGFCMPDLSTVGPR
ncbi:MAG: hypothetical protein GVY16_01200 [Planctomycetes bacterium]|jgi:hypothetical protein|nr:right-handed parallel beta-helix repeat-containing protein [Phycisphaerae bacterium]NBB94343.1 hypothetical protein [Planctomycetota bacterium]